MKIGNILLITFFLVFIVLLFVTRSDNPKISNTNVVAYDNKHDKLWLLNNSGRGVSWEKVEYHKLSCKGDILVTPNGKHCDSVWILEIKEGL